MAGRMVVDDGKAKEPGKSRLGVKSYKHNGDDVVQTTSKEATYKAVVDYLKDNGETKLVEIINGLGIDRKYVQEVVYNNYDTIASTKRGYYKLLPPLT